MYKKDIIPSLWLFLFISCLGFLLLSGRPGISSKEREGDPMEKREEKLKTFREKRNLFFKEDPQSPLKESERKTFKGLLYYPMDMRYAMIGSIERYPIDPRPIYTHLPTSKGTEKKYVKYGRFKFGWAGKEYVLQIYRPLGEGEPFLPFKDRTSEADTYPKGRYLFIETMPGGKVLIDFNRAYNPFCEYNEKYTCTFAPEENWLGIAIRVGEKRFR